MQSQTEKNNRTCTDKRNRLPWVWGWNCTQRSAKETHPGDTVLEQVPSPWGPRGTEKCIYPFTRRSSSQMSICKFNTCDFFFKYLIRPNLAGVYWRMPWPTTGSLGVYSIQAMTSSVICSKEGGCLFVQTNYMYCRGCLLNYISIQNYSFAHFLLGLHFMYLVCTLYWTFSVQCLQNTCKSLRFKSSPVATL